MCEEATHEQAQHKRPACFADVDGRSRELAMGGLRSAADPAFGAARGGCSRGDLARRLTAAGRGRGRVTGVKLGEAAAAAVLPAGGPRAAGEASPYPVAQEPEDGFRASCQPGARATGCDAGVPDRARRRRASRAGPPSSRPAAHRPPRRDSACRPAPRPGVDPPPRRRGRPQPPPPPPRRHRPPRISRGWSSTTTTSRSRISPST